MRLLCFVLIMTALGAHAQPLSSRNKKALAAYHQGELAFRRIQFGQAVTLAEEAIRADKKFEEAYFLKAVSLKKMERLEEATQALKQALPLSTSPANQQKYLYELADSYLKMGNYAASEEMGLRFQQRDSTNAFINLWLRQCRFAQTNVRHRRAVSIMELPAPLNLMPMQYFPVLSADESHLIYTVRAGQNTNLEDEDLYESFRDSAGVWSRPVRLSEAVNSRMREGTATLSADGRTMVVARCGQRGCDLFESKKTGDEWSELIPLQNVNSPSWDSQPSLSADGRTLFFASARPGGQGKADIWFATRQTDGAWSVPVNAGPVVNTPFDEASPFLHPNGVDLFFASAGREGFGGMDLYRCHWAKNTALQPVNLGYPINDYQDQYALFVSAHGRGGYFTQFAGRRQGKLMKVDWDTTLITEKPTVVRGVVSHAKDGQPLSAQVQVFDLLTGESVFRGESDSLRGTYVAILPSRSQFSVRATKTGFLFYSGSFDASTDANEGVVRFDIRLTPAALGASVVLNNLFFDFDSDHLDDRSKTELLQVVEFLRQHTSMRIEISGHTDDVGAGSYNHELSQKRAMRVVEFLTRQGVPSARLRAVGYGASRPLVPNTTAVQRAQNRRIEMRILP